jgi:hypothetical protein
MSKNRDAMNKNMDLLKEAQKIRRENPALAEKIVELEKKMGDTKSAKAFFGWLKDKVMGKGTKKPMKLGALKRYANEMEKNGGSEMLLAAVEALIAPSHGAMDPKARGVVNFRKALRMPVGVENGVPLLLEDIMVIFTDSTEGTSAWRNMEDHVNQFVNSMQEGVWRVNFDSEKSEKHEKYSNMSTEELEAILARRKAAGKTEYRPSSRARSLIFPNPPRSIYSKERDGEENKREDEAAECATEVEDDDDPTRVDDFFNGANPFAPNPQSSFYSVPPRSRPPSVSTQSLADEEMPEIPNQNPLQITCPAVKRDGFVCGKPIPKGAYFCTQHHRCIGKTANGNRCKKLAVGTDGFCNQHRRQ